MTGHKLKSIMQIPGREHSYVSSSIVLSYSNCLLLQETKGCFSQQVVTSVRVNRVVMILLCFNFILGILLYLESGL